MEATYRSPTLDLVPIRFSPRSPIGPDGEIAPVAEIVPRVVDLVGGFAAVVVYDAYVIGHVPPAEVDSVADAAWELGVLAVPDAVDRQLALPFHHLDLADRAPSRFPEGVPETLTSPVPGLFLVSFAFPVTVETLDRLWGCGADRVLGLASRTWLVRASGAESLIGCEGVAELLAWVDPWRLADRVDPRLYGARPDTELLAIADRSSSIEAIAAGIEGVEVLGRRTTDQGELGSLIARSDEAFAALLSEPRLLTIEVAPPPPTLSGERQNQVIAKQGQVIAGVWVPNPGYQTFLTSRGLAGNNQVVLMVDAGFDDGSLPPVASHNPALSGALVGGINIAFFPPVVGMMEDPGGHGTTVAGVLAGRGGSNVTVDKDASGFQYGLGVAPEARIYAAKWYQPGQPALSDPEFLSNLDDATSIANGTHEARVSLNSWNTPNATAYTARSRFHDDLVRSYRDAKDPLSVVFSAGNDFQPPLEGLIEAPSNAKNVIAVGSTDNHHPFGGTPFCFGFPSASGHNPTDIDQVSYFSRRGPIFAPKPSVPRAHNTRIKPDLVAPGWRVHSTTPYLFPAYDSGSTRCAVFDPDFMFSGDDKYTFNLGTSYSAPAVAGVTAHAIQHFASVLGGTNPPSASLLKAALIATADNLGDQTTGCNGDCRPSNDSGWGRVNLDRLTNGIQAFHVNEEWGLGSGQSYMSPPLSVVNPFEPVLIVLAWSDPSDPSSSGSLLHDLDLRVLGPASGFYQNDFYIGNTFHENYVLGSGIDDGWSHHYSGIGRPAVHLDQVNNVEAVFIPPGQVISTLRIQVSAGSIDPLLDPNGQTFSIYAYNLF